MVVPREQEWQAHRSDEVDEALVHPHRYQPEVINILVEHLDKQMQNDFYDLESNLALLKVYLINAKMIDVTQIHKVLLLALLQIPHTDFSLCMFQVPEPAQKDPSIKQLRNLAGLLEGCKFQQFWAEADNCEALKSIKDWQGKIRSYIVGVVQATFSVIDKTLLEDLCNADDMNALMKANNWTVDGSKVVIKSAKEVSAENEAKSSAINLEQLEKVLTAVSR